MSQLTTLSDKRVPNVDLINLGFDQFGMRDPIPTRIDEQITNTNQEFPDSGINGAKIESLNVGRLTAGTLSIDTYIKSTGYVTGVSGWRIDGAGNAEFASLTLTGGTIRYGKTSFLDSTNAGYWIGSSGFYIGAASDTTMLKYTLATGLFDFIGTVSSRSTATLAASINSFGNLVTDVINARLDSSAKTILAGFNFGSANYAGGINAGTITVNTTTGAITGGSGVILYRGGIVGANAGVTTFSIDATTGSAVFGGSLSAATGTLGSLSIASGGSIRLTQTDYNTGVGFWFGDKSGTAKFSIGDPNANYITWDGTSMTLVGDLVTNFGDGSDGTVSASSGTVTVNTAGKYVYQYKSFSLTGTATFSIGSNLYGNPVYILIQGDMTVTSSATPAVNADYAGGFGGAGGTSTGAATVGDYWAGHIEWTNGTQPGGGAGTLVAGGGGSSHSGSGGGGGGGWSTAGTVGESSDGAGGTGGVTYYYSALTQPYRHMLAPYVGGGGGGGGANTTNSPTVEHNGSIGGAGGGAVIFIVRGALNITGAFYARGAAGTIATAGTSSTGTGAGGGGGGGFFGIYYKGTLTANSATFTVTGGSGGTRSGGLGRSGGDGGTGRSEVRQIKSANFVI